MSVPITGTVIALSVSVTIVAVANIGLACCIGLVLPKPLKESGWHYIGDLGPMSYETMREFCSCENSTADSLKKHGLDYIDYGDSTTASKRTSTNKEMNETTELSSTDILTNETTTGCFNAIQTTTEEVKNKTTECPNRVTEKSTDALPDGTEWSSPTTVSSTEEMKKTTICSTPLLFTGPL